MNIVKVARYACVKWSDYMLPGNTVYYMYNVYGSLSSYHESDHITVYTTYSG